LINNNISRNTKLGIEANEHIYCDGSVNVLVDAILGQFHMQLVVHVHVVRHRVSMLLDLLHDLSVVNMNVRNNYAC
jgi:hypothetical protein